MYQSDGPSEGCPQQWSGIAVCGEWNAYQTSPAGGPAALLDLVTIAAHLHQNCAQSLCFCDQTLQKLRPAPSVTTHRRVDLADILIVVGPSDTDIKQIEIEPVIRVLEDGHVGEIVVQHLRHASNGAFDGHIAIEQLGAVRTVFQESVKFAYVLHGHPQALVAKEHIFQTALQVLVCSLQKAVQLVYMLQENVRNVSNGLLQVLMQQMHTKDDLGDGLHQRVIFAPWIVSPMAVVCEVPLKLFRIFLPTQHLLALLHALLGVCKWHEARLAGRIEHGFLEGCLHRGQWVYGKSGRHDVLVALVVPFVKFSVVVEATAGSL